MFFSQHNGEQPTICSGHIFCRNTPMGSGLGSGHLLQYNSIWCEFYLHAKNLFEINFVLLKVSEFLVCMLSDLEFAILLENNLEHYMVSNCYVPILHRLVINCKILNNNNTLNFLIYWIMDLSKMLFSQHNGEQPTICGGHIFCCNTPMGSGLGSGHLLQYNSIWCEF